MPRPSSLTRSVTLLRSRVAASRIRPSGGFPARTRTSGASMPWSAAFRIRWSSGSPISSRIERSSSISSPSTSKRMRLPRSRARSRTSRGKRSNTSPTGVIRDAITSACIPDTSRAIRSLTSASEDRRPRWPGRRAGSWRRPAPRPASSGGRAAGDRRGSGGAAPRRRPRRPTPAPRTGRARTSPAVRIAAVSSSSRGARFDPEADPAVELLALELHQRRPHAGHRPRTSARRTARIARAPRITRVGPDHDLDRAAAGRVGRAPAGRLGLRAGAETGGLDRGAAPWRPRARPRARRSRAGSRPAAACSTALAEGVDRAEQQLERGLVGRRGAPAAARRADSPSGAPARRRR